MLKQAIIREEKKPGGKGALMDYDSNYEVEWDAKSKEFYDKLIAFCEEMYLDEPHILEEAVGILGIHIRECNRQSDNEDIVDEFLAQLDEL